MNPRRSVFARCALLVSLLVLSPPPLAAEGWGDVTAEKVADGIHVLKARGGNIGAVVGDSGIFLVDDQFAPLTAKIRARLDELAGGRGVPVRFVLNTHFHGDHTGGNENMGAAGAVIVAHENVRARMTTEEFRRQFVESGGVELAQALPVVTFNERVTFHLDGRTLASRHYPHAHTDGDSVIWFREANVVHMGDLYFQVGYPFIDIGHGGSIQGLIAAVDDVLAAADARTRIIAGHGQVTGAKELREYRDMLVALRDAVAQQLAAGRSLEEVQAMRLHAPYDARWNWEFIDGPAFVDTIYRSLAGARAAGHDARAAH